MRLLLLIAGLLLALMGLSAEARMHAPYRGHRIVPAASAELPLDGFTTPTVAVSFRKLRSAYAGPAIRIRRASDNAELDINFLGCTGFTGCPWDEAAALAHCTATNCFVRTGYNQGSLGATGNVEQTTTTLQPQVIFNCIGTKPCMQIVATTNLFGLFTVATFTSATGVQSISAVGNRTVGAPLLCNLFRAFTTPSNRISAGAASVWALAATGNINTPATVAEAAWHVAQGVINGASSSLTVDGVTTTGAVTGNTTANTLNMLGGQSGVTCRATEAVMWDGYTLTSGEIAALTANQQGWWAP